MSGVVDGVEVAVVRCDSHATNFDVRFDPPPPDRLPGYPAEHVRLTVRADGSIFAVPVGGAGRVWLHRYPRHSIDEIVSLPKSGDASWHRVFGSLCLEYPRDPDHLRWNWSYGIDGYLHIVQRHLWCEEYWRRHGSWPVADVPHGERPGGRPHPVPASALWIT